MGEVAQLFEVGHDVAQGSRGEAAVQGPGEALGAHGLPRGDVELDERFQYVPAAVVQECRHKSMRDKRRSPLEIIPAATALTSPGTRELPWSILRGGIE